MFKALLCSFLFATLLSSVPAEAAAAGNRPRKPIIPGRVIVTVTELNLDTGSANETGPTPSQARIAQSRTFVRERILPRLRKLVGSRSSNARSRHLYSNRSARRQGARRSRGEDHHHVIEFPDLTDDPASAEAETERLIANLRGQLNVEVEPDYLVTASYTPNDPHFPPAIGAWGQSFPNLWGLEKLNVARAWDRTMGDGQVVAVIDTGVDYNHPDLAGQVVNGWNFVSGNADPMDDNGHGTHVAGTVAAIGNNGIGIVGVAPHSRILPLKVLASTGSGTMSAVASAISYAADNGATVINMSLGAAIAVDDVPSYFTSAIKYAHDRQVIIVAAAGNSNEDAYLFSPANDPNVITVAASDHTDQRAFFSNYGGKIAVSAPGGGDRDPSGIYDPSRSILSLKAAGARSSITGNGQLVVGGGYLRQSGTSMAAPHVAGVAALVRAAHPEYSAEQVRQVIEKGSDDVGSLGFDPSFGYGRVNAASATEQAPPLAVQITRAFGSLKGVPSVDVYGSVGGPNLREWRLQYSNGAPWVTLASGTNALVDQKITTWDLTAAPEGAVTLRLLATNLSDVEYEFRVGVVVDQVYLTSPSPVDVAVIRGGTTIDIRGTVNSASLTNYMIEVFRIEDGSPVAAKIVLVNGGTQRVVNGTLASWDTAGLAADRYEVRLSVYNSNYLSALDSAEAIVDPTLHPGWPIKLGRIDLGGGWYVGIRDHLITADLLRNGKQAVLVAHGTKVHAYDENGVDLPGWPRDVGAYTQYSPAVNDLDGDGFPEVVASTGTRLFVWNRMGQPLPGWPRSIPGRAITIADLNRDGLKDIITSFRNTIHAVDRFGTALPGFPLQLQYQAFHQRVSVGDVDRDGVPELALAVTDYVQRTKNIYLLRNNGAVMPGWPIPGDYNGLDTAPILADIDSDGRAEILFPNGNAVRAHHVDGTAVRGWPQSTANVALSLSLGDIFGDQRPEIFSTTSLDANRQFEINAYRSDGSLLAGWPLKLSTTWFNFGQSTPAVADVDGDRLPDVILGTPSGRRARSLHAFRYDGTEIPGFPKHTIGVSADFSITPAVADLDGNGTPEVLFLDSEFNLYAWDLPIANNNARPWPMFQRDASLSGALPADDVKPPILTSVAVSGINESSATLTWVTDEPSSSVVRYGTDPGALSQVIRFDSPTFLSHLVTLNALAASTTYYFKVASRDATGNEASSDLRQLRTDTAYHILFVSSQKYTGDLGGVTGADEKCRQLAVAANLRPTARWKAVLSSATQNARDRILVRGPVYNPSPTNPLRLVDDPQSLFEGDIKKPVVFSDRGEKHESGKNVWTGSHGDGTAISSATCQNWTSGASGYKGVAGGTEHTSGQWLSDSNNEGNEPCLDTKRLYCISQ